MTVQAATLQRDIRKIRDNKTLAELEGYDAEARTRGYRDGEKAEIDRQRLKLKGYRK
jgi:hypothetical protein